ncbi:hypothetical protein PENSPDRAFT_750898 [Peniophora sp. CONT]|nr:hypothetical protein PENSPDRAFT_750898 [Peniophora sp. CONT]
MVSDEARSGSSMALGHRGMLGPSAPIRGLPVEVLADIFLWLVVLCPVNFDAERVPAHSKIGWLVITQVCSLWRNLSIDSPRLWTRVDGTMGREWVHVFLARSKTAPITFTNFYLPTISRKDPRITIADEVLPVHLARMQVLVLRQPVSGPLHPALLHRAPLLEVLTLFGDFLLLAESDWEFFEAPQLQHLHVLSCSSFPWKSLSIRNLCSLTLVQNIDRLIDQRGPDAQDFVTALRGMSQLGQLCLENSLPSSPWSNIGNFKLPRLRALRIHGQLLQVVDFLTHLHPSRIELDVACRDALIDNSPYDLLRMLATHLNVFDEGVPLPFQAVFLTQRLTSRSPWIYIHAIRHIVDQGWEPARYYPRDFHVEDLDAARKRRWELDDRFLGYCDTPSTQSFSLTLNFMRPSSEDLQDFINRTLASLPIQTAQLLVYDQVVDARDIFATATIDRPFANFLGVRSLRVGRDIFPAFIRSLNAQDMPKLEHLYFPDLTPAHWENVMGGLTKLHEFVADRDKMGRRVRSLYLVDKDAHVRAWSHIARGRMGPRVPARLVQVVKELV